jgi:tetratricopeptide (TPR) repeat protein
MKIFLMVMLAVLPVSAAEDRSAQEAVAIPMELDSSAFNNDVESVSEKIRRLLWESRREKYGREINSAIASRDTGSAQKALDGLVRDYPELKKQEPHALEYHQGSINFWNRDFNGAYKEFDAVVKGLEAKYPDGIPAGGKFSEINASFMAGAYFSRGAVEMQRGNFAKADRDISRAILISPKPVAYMYLNRCRTLIRMKKYQEASTVYDLASNVDSGWVTGQPDNSYSCAKLSENGFRPKNCQAGI